jgi:ribose transport system substrate-binding protein
LNAFGPRRLGLCLAVAVAAGAVVAGTADARGTHHAKPAAKIKIGYINLSDKLPFVVLVRKGIEAAAKKAGVTLVECDSELDAQKAINCAAQLKSQGVQGIANFQLDTQAAPRVCAAGPKVPVIAIDIHQPPCEKVFYGANNTQAGKLTGIALGQYAKKTFKCKVDAVLSLNDPTAGKVVADRENGEITGLHSQCPGLPITKVKTDSTTDGTIQPSTDTLSRLPGKHKILVVATNDDEANGMIKAAQSGGRLGDIYISAQGGDPTSWPSICGKTSFKHWIADTGYFPELYGQTVVPTLLSMIDGQSEPKMIYVAHRTINAANIRSIYPKACK